MAPHSSTLAWKIHGRRSLVGCSPWGREKAECLKVVKSYSQSTLKKEEQVGLLQRGGEGTGTPLQCSCLENPRDGGAWWAAVYGVAQSWTGLMRLSSSSSSSSIYIHTYTHTCLFFLLVDILYLSFFTTLFALDIHIYNPMEGGAWQAAVHGVAKSWT